MAAAMYQTGESVFLVVESPEAACVVRITDGYISPRGHPLSLTKGGWWEDVSNHEGATEALRLYTENPPTITIPVVDPLA